MNTKFRKFIGFLPLMLLMVTSCTTPKYITIEIPQKAKQELPERIQSLVLVNRTVDDSYTDTAADTLQNIFFKKGFDVDTVIHDRQSADTMLQALGQLLFESGRYDYVIPVDRFIDHEKNAFLSETMPWNEVKELCDTFNTDAVLSVDMFTTRVITNFNRDTYYNPADDAFYEMVKAQMAVVYETLFRIYDPSEDKVIIREYQRDTLYWEDGAGSARELFSHFTTVKQGLSEAGIAAALDFSEKISTVWYREQRQILSDKDAQMTQAENLVNSNDWPSAMEIWKKVAAESSSKATKSKAAFNLAVAYELQGNVDEAIKWGLESYNTMFRQVTYDYLERLKLRRQELEKLK
ncbi:DUF6340 family protein [Maribellus sp. YY47]|uniref:DUF6340 family protein n=1 Tax=Maribellus sp. YY47 TaxID=2929486 RepID=UPI002001BDB7|nr:DUF6340 family protein [Maribellus sp. YY47]MCK3685017.1 tetratricopeptide repeat protein [Maribellus sp. YY47]